MTRPLSWPFESCISGTVLPHLSSPCRSSPPSCNHKPPHPGLFWLVPPWLFQPASRRPFQAAISPPGCFIPVAMSLFDSPPFWSFSPPGKARFQPAACRLGTQPIPQQNPVRPGPRSSPAPGTQWAVRANWLGTCPFLEPSTSCSPGGRSHLKTSGNTACFSKSSPGEGKSPQQKRDQSTRQKIAGPYI